MLFYSSCGLIWDYFHSEQVLTQNFTNDSIVRHFISYLDNNTRLFLSVHGLSNCFVYLHVVV